MNPASTTKASERWVKARRSDNANACVEVMLDEHGLYYLRDSKAAGLGPVVTLSEAGWSKLCMLVEADHMNAENPVIDRTFDVTLLPCGGFTVAQSVAGEQVTLSFTRTERECFIDGVAKGEFRVAALAGAGSPRA